jgi:hypothetical protein
VTVKTDQLLIQKVRHASAQNRSLTILTTNVLLAKGQTTLIKLVTRAKPVKKDQSIIKHQEAVQKLSAQEVRY